MPANTSPDNIEYPVSTDPVAPLETVFANMANSVQDALDGFRTDWNDFEDNRAIQTFRWADATARAAQTGMVAGDIGYQEDTLVTYRYSGSAWKAWESGWISHTPSWTNLTVGSGTVTAFYRYMQGDVQMRGRFVMGTGSAISGAVRLAPVVAMDSSYYGTAYEALPGTVGIRDVGTSLFSGEAWSEASSTQISLMAALASGTYLVPQPISGAIPMTWAAANGDTLTWDFSYKAA